MAKEFAFGCAQVWYDSTSPGVSETLINLGNGWIDTSTGNYYVCVDATVGAQIWNLLPKSTVSVSKGGTGATTLTSHGVLIGAGTSAVAPLAAASTGTVLTGVTGADPAFSATPAVTSVSIGSGALTITSGSGAPGSSQPKGSLYLRTDGSGINDRIYVATNSSGTWTAIVTVA